MSTKVAPRVARSARALTLALASPLLLALGSCGEVDPTEVVVVVTGDFAVPSELDRVVLEITPPSGLVQTAEADLTEVGFPRSLGLSTDGGSLGPYRVEATGFLGGSLVVRGRAVFQFQRDRSLEIELPLLTECVDVICLCSAVSCSTCGEGATCRSATVAPQPFDGVSRGLDGALPYDLAF